MKMICDVPDEVIKSVRMGTWCGSSVAEKMIANGTPIPDNVTNGDVLQIIFPDKENFNGGHGSYFDKTWWDALYQKGGK